MRKFSALAGLLLLAYPLAVYAGISHGGVGPVTLLLGVLFLLRMTSSKVLGNSPLKHVATTTGIIGFLLVTLSYVFKQHDWFLYYPVAVNTTMFVVFATSLLQPMSIIEQVARLQEPDLPASGVKYTRNVTKVWCLFFLVNGAIAWWTCLMSLEIWTLYNGLLSYLAAGALFGIEFIIRNKVRSS
ncbi:COG4648 family protein [Grimontia marina]|uniref:Intracellular septation protein A n=1 Tax=Grimontia marina TaxID=646534 RepID=A0A128EVX4_9GAMM|nr:hypothetical protein [Grimontia marina]CZF78719.1 hypothetical protein GMA8713_00687 [Grimontia marina]